MKKRTHTLVLLALVLIFSSCSEEENSVEIPPGILKQEQFAKILTDLALAESAANLNIKNVKIEKIDSTYAFDPFKENNTTQQQYDSSAHFYSMHPDLYKEAYEKSMQMLVEMQAKRAQLQAKTDSARKDSVRK
ncbi:MAG: hypothetical protein K0S32_3359 [Bacteroidetes bacterium]|jgi:hypothetical protein|nr:hypothetical protein [Bacteroidota bacterium]